MRWTTFLIRARFFFSVVISCLCAGYLLTAQPMQSPPAPQKSAASDLVLKTIVRRVIVDVVVTDANDKPVHDLTQKDFSVTEDGVPQRILSFDVHDLKSESDFAKLPPLPPNTFVNIPSAPERGPLYVLLLDLVNTGLDSQMWARQQLLKFIRDRPAGTRFAIFVLADGLHLVEGFTDDKEKLFAAVDPGNPKAHIPRVFLNGANAGSGDPVAMISVFNFIAQYLDGLPGRKNLMWFSGGFPMRLNANDNDPPDVQDDIRKALDALVRAQVAVYPIDVNGITLGDSYRPEATGGHLVYVAARSTVPLPAQTQPRGVSPLPPIGTGIMMGNMNLDNIAQATGGRAFYSRNDLEQILIDATNLGANYYTLTYAPTNQSYDGKLRKIKIEFSKKGYQLDYRRAYYADDLGLPTTPASSDHRASRKSAAAEPAVAEPDDSLYAYMRPGAPMAHQLFFRAHIYPVGAPALATAAQMSNLEAQPAYFRVRRKNRPAEPLSSVPLQTYAIDYTFLTSSPKAETNQPTRPPMLEVAAGAFDADGGMLNGMVQSSVQNSPGSRAGQNPRGIFRVQQQIDVPLSATSIRVAVRDISTDRIGAMEVSLPLAVEAQAQAATPK